ncbi:hypothetical protein VN0511_15380 [Helicobacter pylori]|nr:hypothetical protein VN0511_15380 [Helicobacter pylori]
MFELEKELKELFEIYEKSPYELYLVGGCVRDCLMGITPKDYDLTSNALVNESKELLLKHHFRVLETGIKHGMITALKNNQSYEITTFRIEKGHIKHRKPKELVFSARLTDDLKRRDFSMNAIAYSPTKGLIDPFKGQNAIENQMIECVGEARLRFFEDALRILRALRFSATLGFKIAPSTKEAVFAYKDLLKHLSKERLQSELNKLLMGKNAYEVAKEYQEILELVTQEKIENLGFLKNAPFNLELRLLGFFKHQKSLENLRYPKKTCVLFLKAKECYKAFLNTHNKTELKFLLKNYDLEPFNLALDFYVLKNPKHALKIKSLLKEIFNANEPFKKEHLALKGGMLQNLGYQRQQISEILNACLNLVIANPKNSALEWLIKWVKDHYLPNDAINLSPIGKKNYKWRNMITMNAIQWPKKWIPGETDNFVSNEVIVKGLDFNKVVQHLRDASHWEKYYKNSGNIHMHNQDNTILKDKTRFCFETFGFLIEAQVEEFELKDTILRLAWRGWNEAKGDEYLEVYHAWLVEKLENNRVRILTQESQLGVPAKALAASVPNAMLNGHQAWLDGLVAYSH